MKFRRSTGTIALCIFAFLTDGACGVPALRIDLLHPAWELERNPAVNAIYPREVKFRITADAPIPAGARVYFAIVPGARPGGRAADFGFDFDVPLVSGAGPGGGPHLVVWNVTPNGVLGAPPVPIYNFFAGEPEFTGGIRVGCGDVDRDGRAAFATTPGTMPSAASERFTSLIRATAPFSGGTPPEAPSSTISSPNPVTTASPQSPAPWNQCAAHGPSSRRRPRK